MTEDVEMNTVPLLKDKEEENEHKANDVNSLHDVPDVEVRDLKQSKTKREEFTGLTKEELEKFAKDPFWRRLRLILFILFWVIWVTMLVVAILIVVFTPKCPVRPKLEFWQKKTGYWVDPYAFADSQGDGVGDFDGIIKKLDYIQKEVGAGYIILDPIFKGHYTNSKKKMGLVENFREVDPVLGDMAGFKKLVKECNKRAIEVVLAIDINGLAQEGLVKKLANAQALKPITNEAWVTRNGAPLNTKYYSVFPDKVDLDLTNKSVIAEIKDSVKMWLDIGVMGLLLTNVPFYIENTTATSKISEMENANLTWFEKQYAGTQLFTEETKSIISEIRSTLDEVAKRTDKTRVLIADAGQVGFGLSDSESELDSMLRYMSPPANKSSSAIKVLADVVVSREFMLSRGSSLVARPGEAASGSVANYLRMVSATDRANIGLASSTSTNMRSQKLFDIAAPFILQGNPIMYYGSELGMSCTPDQLGSLSGIYPADRTYPLEEVTKETTVRCNHLAMPWDDTGAGFFNAAPNTTNSYFFSQLNTVQSVTAAGHGETVFQLYKKLLKLKTLPSLLWGDFEWIYQTSAADKAAGARYEVFLRKATGFPSIIVALIEDNRRNGRALSFANVCKKNIVPKLVYPSNPNLKEDVTVEVSNIFFLNDKVPSLHILECEM